MTCSESESTSSVMKPSVSSKHEMMWLLISFKSSLLNANISDCVIMTVFMRKWSYCIKQETNKGDLKSVIKLWKWPTHKTRDDAHESVSVPPGVYPWSGPVEPVVTLVSVWSMPNIIRSFGFHKVLIKSLLMILNLTDVSTIVRCLIWQVPLFHGFFQKKHQKLKINKDWGTII